MANSMVPSIKEIPINRGEQHLAVCIALDNSASLHSQAHELSDSLRLLIDEINSDTFTRGRVDLCILTFNDSVHKLVPFAPAPNCEVPSSLRCDGMTAMYEALDVSLREIEKHNALYTADKIRRFNFFRGFYFHSRFLASKICHCETGGGVLNSCSERENSANKKIPISGVCFLALESVLVLYNGRSY